MTDLDEAALNAACREDRLPWRVIVLDETRSTNDWLRQRAAEPQITHTAVFAQQQSAGRGRRDHVWRSQPGKDLLFSLMLRPPGPPAQWPRVTTLIALAACRAIEAELPLQPQIKWPNDLYLQGRKFAGILAETTATAEPSVILGMGINVNSTGFPPELHATSLLEAMGGRSAVPALDRGGLALRLLAEFTSLIDTAPAEFAAHVGEVRRRSWLLGKQIRAQADGRDVFGRAIDLDAEGALILALPDGSRRVLSSAESVRAVV